MSESAGNSHEPPGGRGGLSRRELFDLFNPGRVDSRWGRLVVDGLRCSACALCAGACEQKSLVSVETEGSNGMALTFRQDLCDHCGRCLEACPEKALSHVTSPGKGGPSEVIVLFKDEPARCLKCGTVMGSKAMVRCVSARLEKTDPVLAAKVQLCGRCREG
jgi:ferredoxin